MNAKEYSLICKEELKNHLNIWDNVELTTLTSF